MKKLLVFALLLFIFHPAKMFSQDMNNEKLYGIFYTISEDIQGQDGSWQFIIDSTLFICLTDQLHNRMRIVSPIVEVSELSPSQIKRCMEANFHSALDARYAISDGYVWSAFIHPLTELTKEQVINAVSQVYSCAKTFGTSYSSGMLSFPTNEERKAGNN